MKTCPLCRQPLTSEAEAHLHDFRALGGRMTAQKHKKEHYREMQKKGLEVRRYNKKVREELYAS